MRRIPFIGPFPKPTHGQSVATDALYTELVGRHALRKINTSGGPKSNKLRRLVAHAVAVWVAASGSSPLYISANSNSGMWLTTLIVCAASLRRRHIFLHHHAFDHFRRFRPAMSLLCKAGGARLVHIVLGPAMAGKLAELYPHKGTSIIINNASFVSAELAKISRKKVDGTITFGHLSNLTAEKGVMEVVKAAIRISRFHSVRLVIAGPANDDVAKSAIRLAEAELGGEGFSYLGPVFDQRKVDFFSSIDFFLFPSTYGNEAEPIVLLEAMAAGVPSIAYDVGCISFDLSSGGGLCVSLRDEFDIAAERIFKELLSSDPAVSFESARARFCSLLDANAQQIAQFQQMISSHNARKVHSNAA